MKTYQNTTVVCPNCGRSFKVRQYTSINPYTMQKQMRSIFNRFLFQEKCPYCHQFHAYPYSFSCRLSRTGITLFYAVNQKDKEALLKEHEGESDVRITDDLDDFEEKYLISDHGYDDRIIEIQKYFLLKAMQRENPEITKARYDFILSSQQISGSVICGLAGEMVRSTASVDMLYDDLRIRLEGDLDHYSGETLVVDQKWAEQFLSDADENNTEDLEKEASSETEKTGTDYFFDQVENLEMESKEKEAADLIAEDFDHVWDDVLDGRKSKPTLEDLDVKYENLFNAVNDFSMILMNEKKYKECMHIIKRILETTDLSDNRLTAMNLRRDYMECIGRTEGFDAKLKYLEDWMKEDPDDPYLYGTEIDVWLYKDPEKARRLALRYVDTPLKDDTDEWLLDSCSNVVQETGDQELKKKLAAATKKYQHRF